SLVRLKVLTDELVMRENTSQALGLEPALSLNGVNNVENAAILLVEDQPRAAARVTEALEPLGSVDHDSGVGDFPARARQKDYDLVIVSLGLENVDGLRLCSQLRSTDETRNVPILVIVDENN